MQQFAARCLMLILLIISPYTYADKAFAHRKDVQRFITTMVNEHGFNRAQLTNIMAQVVIQPKIIESMERPYEKKTWDVYRELFLTPQRLEAGMAFWQANQDTLAKVEKQYNVPASLIVAIVGVETLYGKHQGTYRVLDALSTLAFEYPKRSPYFTKELGEFFLLCREHNVSPTQYMGSYAGAMGKAQFMPSSYRHFATDFTNNPRKDLMNDDKAVIASIANYMHQHGWQGNQAVAQPAKVSGYRVKRININNKSAAYTQRQLLAAGVRPIHAALHSPKKAGLIELVNPNSKEYWLAYPNFYVITRYNSSPQYALVVYLFSQQLQHSWMQAKAKKKVSYV